MRSQTLGGAHLSSLSGHEGRAHQLVPASDHSAWPVPLVSFDLASSDQRDGARESAHHTRARPPGQSRWVGADRHRLELPTTKGTRAGSSSGEPVLQCRGALGALWSPPRATSRTRLRHRRGDQACGRSLIARPHGVRLGGTMRVHMVRNRPRGDGRSVLKTSGQPRVDSTTTGHRCWSTRGYHAWTKRITVLAAGSKANANERCLPSRASGATCRWTGRRGDARARPAAGTPGRA
jgi:hypothetical protein